MPGENTIGFSAERFAALWAGFDTGNVNEAEAIGKARALRRMVAGEGLRIIDVIGRADVRQALDAQLKPAREDTPELREAFVQIAQLADRLKEADELVTGLRGELANTPRSVRSSLDSGLVNGGLVMFVVGLGLALMIAATLH
jgi:hypothetical protein